MESEMLSFSLGFACGTALVFVISLVWDWLEKRKMHKKHCDICGEHIDGKELKSKTLETVVIGKITFDVSASVIVEGKDGSKTPLQDICEPCFNKGMADLTDR